MAFSKSQQSGAWFALLFGGVFFVVFLHSHVQSSPFPHGMTTTGIVTGVETRGDGLVSKKASTTLVQFTDSQGATRHGKLPHVSMRTGTRIPISYCPQAPTTIRHLDPDFTPTQVAYLLAGFGIMVFISLIILIPSRLRRFGKIEKAADHLISPMQTAMFLGFAVIFVAVGIWFNNAQRKVQTSATVVALEQPSSDVGQQRAYVSYNDAEGDVSHAWVDMGTKLHVGDKLAYSYTPKTGDFSQILSRFPWIQNCIFVVAVPLLILLLPEHMLKNEKKNVNSGTTALG